MHHSRYTGKEDWYLNRFIDHIRSCYLCAEKASLRETIPSCSPSSTCLIHFVEIVCMDNHCMTTASPSLASPLLGPALGFSMNDTNEYTLCTVLCSIYSFLDSIN